MALQKEDNDAGLFQACFSKICEMPQFREIS
jgi:hypothetical protein